MLSREVMSAEHGELSKLAAALQLLVDQSRPDGVRVAQARWALSRLLATHLAAEDVHVYPRLQASGDRAVAALANRFAHQLGGLAARWRSYMADWQGERVRTEWPAFCAETKTIMQALERRIEQEEQQLYPLLDRLH